MKTICPNCYQKYNVSDEDQGKELTCEKCQRDFVAGKAKFCPECGIANTDSAAKCRKCDSVFLVQEGKDCLTVCPGCHQQYEVPEELLGTEVTCEKCQHGFFTNKAKFCTECGTANPAQAFQCHTCQYTFQPLISTTEEEAPQSDANDRSRAKLNLLMYILILIFGVGCGFSALRGIGMVIAGLFQGDDKFGIRLFSIIFGACAVAIYGRLTILISTLIQPNKKAVQTSYDQLSMVGCGILSIVGLVFSVITFTGTMQIVYIALNLLTLLLIYKIYRLWTERCIMDENYEVSEESSIKVRKSSLARISIILGIAGLLPMAGFFFSTPAMIIGIIANRRGNKIGFVGMLLGIIGFIGNIIFCAVVLGE